jgi:phosphatidylglycerophosphate synthase
MEEERKLNWRDQALKPIVEVFPPWVKPNHLTYARAALVVPVAACLWHDLNILAVVFLSIAVLLDMLDGAMARIRNHQTSNGEWLDAYADKLLIVGLLLIYGWDHFPAALIWIVFMLEAVLCLGRPIKIWLGKSGKANAFGKIKMWLQSAAVIGLAAHASWTLVVANVTLWSALVFASLSVIFHLRDIFARSQPAAG